MQSTAGRPQLMLAHFVAILLAAPTLAMMVLTLVGTVTAPLGVGLLLLSVAVPTTRLLATGQRGIAEVALQEPITREYRDTSGLGLINRIQQWARDPARWRDLLWELASVTIGFTLSVLSIALFLYPIWSIVWFGLWKGLPDVFDQPYGMQITTTPQAVGVSAGGVVIGALLWWFTAKPIARWRFGLDAYLLGLSRKEVLARRVQEVTTSRAQGADAAAAELRRVERDLHDGAQARLVALGMNLGLAAELIEKDPDAARQLLLEARDNSGVALQDIRSVVRGIHPPVLADRGLADAIRAVAVDLPIDFDLDLRPPPLSLPLESAVYFGIAECLANMGKHARATAGWVRMAPRAGLLYVEIGDNGVGGADPRGSGIQGVAGRLAVFDGTMVVSSPPGGPTIVTMEVPCAQ
ncbi:MAG TPA: sensor domain-containing protein [Flexivirga sp.]|uniref:sensor histidine kinase n=1 Tax=Flexivirga sp. TaxID=1962927 RepID=UPI002B9D7AE5|nr:sensor domain-containing protein [Flexivirga sp.]HWC21492.1 sensor domain-containing protein [Flexivirga sp.]